ncbi:DEKNAAC105344 [Brettanomyces naardenensis]|uniref:Oxidation resistance protein 1 n=1 Tax=Brettanomyces naardenensis TaxID=13370 RepID=A0A448YTL7_BRENA|nr:DEKNAAC105344 [Brettanomyces naardenensis]
MSRSRSSSPCSSGSSPSSRFKSFQEIRSGLRSHFTPSFSKFSPSEGQQGRQASPQRQIERQQSFEYDIDPPLNPLKLKGYKLSTKRKLMTPELAEDLRQNIPSVLQISHSWTLRYSLEQDGTSLNTLYAKCEPQVGENVRRRRGYFMVVMDSHGDRFGAYLNDYLRPQDGRHYYGNGDCFLWKTERTKVKKLKKQEDKLIDLGSDEEEYEERDSEVLRLKVFPYTSINDFIIYSNHEFISIGSGNGKFGLWIDSSFVQGATDSVETFGNEPLSRDRKFSILGLEIWKVD